VFQIVIPARFAASRLPGKPLLDIHGKPMIQWVWERATQSGAAGVLIATDDERIRLAAHSFGADVVMTSVSHTSGTDRIAEVAQARHWAPELIVVNVQGDEPLMPPAVISAVAHALRDTPHADIATAVTAIRSLEELTDPNCVKAVYAQDRSALYFSRAPIPWPRDKIIAGKPQDFSGARRHLGIYAFRVASLLRFASLAPTELEISERLEQLRALEHGMRIQIVELPQAPPAGVDTPEDLQRVRSVLAS
jgi:3-deoxy-manno-octulosonate cytidylyltransferase (CMP-KDO synthetase)